MLAATSGLDWEGSLLRASDGAGVRIRLRMSDWWNLRKMDVFRQVIRVEDKVMTTSYAARTSHTVGAHVQCTQKKKLKINK